MLHIIIQSPAWFTVILSIIKDNILPVIECIILTVCQKLSDLQNTSPDITKFLHVLPCGCHVDSDTDSGMRLLITAISI